MKKTFLFLKRQIQSSYYWHSAKLSLSIARWNSIYQTDPCPCDSGVYCQMKHDFAFLIQFRLYPHCSLNRYTRSLYIQRSCMFCYICLLYFQAITLCSPSKWTSRVIRLSSLQDGSRWDTCQAARNHPAMFSVGSLHDYKNMKETITLASWEFFFLFTGDLTKEG